MKSQEKDENIKKKFFQNIEFLVSEIMLKVRKTSKKRCSSLTLNGIFKIV